MKGALEALIHTQRGYINMNPKVLKFVKRIYIEQKRVVDFVPRGTICPVCEYLEMADPKTIRIIKTVGETRYCECLQCGCHFRAYAERENYQAKSTKAPTPSIKRIEEGAHDDNQQHKRRVKPNKRRH